MACLRRQASQTKKNKQIDGTIFYSLYVLFRVTHAFDNLLHFPMCFSCPEVHVFFAVYSGSEREGIEIIFSYYSAPSDDFLLQSALGFFMLPKQLFKSKYCWSRGLTHPVSQRTHMKGPIESTRNCRLS